MWYEPFETQSADTLVLHCPYILFIFPKPWYVYRSYFSSILYGILIAVLDFRLSLRVWKSWK